MTAFHRVATCAVGLVAAAFSPCALAAPATLLREAYPVAQLKERPGAPLTGRYQMDDGGSFVLDRSTPKPLMKFDDDLEIWALQPAPGPRGDTIYRNDTGEPMLRATRIGGMTVFTPKRPEGSAAALNGGAPPLRLTPMSPQALFRVFYQASLRASRAAGRQIAFETKQDADPSSAAYLADAAQVASEALVDVAATPGGKAALSHISGVVFAQGGKGGVAIQKGVITVTISIAQGIFGRPSSHRIERAAWGK
ncbi:MAG TPA: DUF4908 domain-containing protein [Caulobacteraceae bacterium]|nr:DUF4908 domain-containing protein [Caulobacteraceae bacterium]